MTGFTAHRGPHDPGWSRVERTVYEQALKGLRATVAILTIVELAVIARILIHGLTVTTAATAIVILPFLLWAALLWHEARRLARDRDRDRDRAS
jgi:Flp pilus assembly protein TadB